MSPQNETEVLPAWQKGNQLFARFVDFYARLTAVTSQTRRRLAVGIGTAALMLALSSAPTPAYAAEINVGGSCTLVMAIQNANDTTTGQPNLACAPGNPAGADTIVLAGSPPSYTTTSGTQAALPNITSPITIEANGATIQRTGGAIMRLIRVDAGGNLTLNNATITGGGGVFSGGGIDNYGGTLTLNNSTVSGNTAIVGGGISTSANGVTILNNSTVSGNTANYGGGGISTNNGTTILNNSTVSGNTATSDGGGIENFNISNTTLNNSTVSGNAATNGGGIFANNSNTTLNNSTVTGNTATTRGGGIDNFSGTTTLNRSIVSGNTSPTGAEVRLNNGTITAANHNVFGHSGRTNDQAFSGFTPGATDITATSNGTNPTALASILNPTLANNGGPTLTHALVSGSPAIDIAPAGDCSGAPIDGLDQRGVARSIDGDLDSTAACDAGAVEQEVPQVCGIVLLTDYTLAGATLNATNLGSDLNCFQVALINKDHPHATSSASNDALETGRFWRIRSLQSDGTTPATTNFDVSLTLPYANADTNSRVCRWLGVVPPTTGFGWDCTGTGSGGLVTRTGISSFSDWAVGDNVGPTAVTLQSFTAVSQQGGVAALIATLLTALSGAWLWVRRPGKAERQA